jgi:hypothetical protein
MEESLMDALASAGEMLAEVVRTGLAAQGLPGEVSVIVRDGRIMVASRSATVRDAEVGTRRRAPGAVLETIGRDNAGRVVAEVAKVLGGRVL